MLNGSEDAEKDAEEEDAEEEDAEEEDAEEEDAEEEDAEEEDAEEEDAEEEDAEEEEELVEIIVDGKKYYADENKVGSIYECLDNEEVGDEIGHYVNGEAIIF